MHDARWTIIIPVKRLATGKSRLRDAPADDALVLAVALDTIDAAHESDAVGRVLVVTSDATVADAVPVIGAETVADRPDAGLNLAIALGSDAASRRREGVHSARRRAGPAERGTHRRAV